MRLSTKLSGIVAVGGVAALGAGLISSGGIGAVFTSQATAKATVDVGNLDCTVSSETAGTIPDGAEHHSITVPLGTITSSVASSKTASVKVTNDGTIPLYVSWDVKTSGDFFNTWTHSYTPVTQNASVTNDAIYDIGAYWNELNNDDLRTSGTVTYTANCSDQPAALWFADNAGGSHTVSDSALTLTVPMNPAPGAGVEVHIAKAAGANPPTSEPVFHSTPGTVSGSPRLSILLSNTSRIIIDSDGTIQGGGDWSQLTDGLTVKDAMIVADTSAGAGNIGITCINYDGVVFGNC